MKRSLCVMAVALSSVFVYAQLPDDVIRAQVPEIHEILPEKARSGDVVRIFGQNFDRTPTNNIVHFGGAKARVLRSWVSELEVELPPAIQPGPVTIVVSNRLAMSQVPFQPRFAPFGTTNPVHAPMLSFTGRRHPTAVDLDHDGKLELVLARHPNFLEIYKYVGTGPLLGSNSFVLAAEIPGFTNISSLRYFDLQSDGRYDVLAVSTNSGARVLVNYIPNGEIATNHFGYSNVPGGSSVSDFSDVDRDGILDLITLSGSRVYGVRGLPRGSHESFSGSTLISGFRNISSMAIGDLNRDGHVDVVALDSQGLRIYSHDGRVGDMSTFIEISIPALNLSVVEIADIEGDGWPDILVFNQSSWQCEVFWNRNIGGHLSVEDFTRVTLIGRERSRLVTPRLMDLDGDSFPDLLTLFSTYNRNESALLGEIIFPGSFATTNRSTISFETPVGIISADLNADGIPEVITDNGVVYQNTTTLGPVITYGYFKTDGSFYIDLRGRPNEVVTIHRSTNLVSWTAIRQVTLGPNGNSTSWVGEPLEPTRFFRVSRP